jgi:hypothetical protein
MTEKYRYGPLIYNCFGDDDDSGNYWWSGNPPVGYEAESGPYRIPIDADGNQCLPGECILHPNCKVKEFEYNQVLDDDLPSVSWCKDWFVDNFLIVSDWQVCKYILRWYWWNNQHEAKWKAFANGKTKEEMIQELWPDAHKS